MRATQLVPGSLFAFLLAFGNAALSQQFTGQVVTVIVNYSAGGPADILARFVSEKLSATWKQPVIIENKPGAGTIIGTDFVAKAPPDGYTLLMGSPGLATNKFLYKDLTFDPSKDFAPVSLIGIVPNVLVINPSVPAKTVSELVALARKSPATLNYASPGYGTSLHLAAELFKASEKIDIVHVPYKGMTPAITDLMAGQVQLLITTFPSIGQQIGTGRVRAIAVTSPARSPGSATPSPTRMPSSSCTVTWGSTGHRRWRCGCSSSRARRSSRRSTPSARPARSRRSRTPTTRSSTGSRSSRTTRWPTSPSRSSTSGTPRTRSTAPG